MSRFSSNLARFTHDNSIGFDRSRFHFDQYEDLDEYVCGICHGILKNPLVTDCCGQTYCSNCINQWLIQSGSCPNDRRSLKKGGLRAPPIAFKNLLSNLKIKCDFELDGCKALVKLTELDSHRKCCPFRPNIKCKDCGLHREKASTHKCVQSLRLLNEELVEDRHKLTEQKLQLIKENQKQKKDFEKQINELKSFVENEVKNFRQLFTVKLNDLAETFLITTDDMEHQLIQKIDNKVSQSILDFNCFKLYLFSDPILSIGTTLTEEVMQ